MPPGRTPRQRQDPVSCDSCRKKKLRCDRKQPCANCQSRGLQCHFQGRPSAAHVSPPATMADQSLRQENTVMRARLQRLEDAVFGRESGENSPLLVNGTSYPNHSLPARNTVQSISQPDRDVNMYSEDSRWLEEQGTRGTSGLPHLSGEPIVRIESVHSFIHRAGNETALRSIILPELTEASYLLDCYLDHVDTLQHVMYIPHVRYMISQIYESMSDDLDVKYSKIALLLAILATITSYWSIGEAGASVFKSRNDARDTSQYWTRCTLDVLAHAWRTETPDIPMVQVCMLLVFLLYQMEGYSSKLRVIHLTGLSCAREIGLHLTDSLRTKRPVDTQEQIIDTEMRRRIWWHLCSTDWSSSLVGGPGEGVYCIDPRHTRVNKPRNITDEDLATKPADFDRPLSDVTSNTYYIQRIQLGEVCREVADITWDLAEVTTPEDLPYDRILSVDAKFEQLLDVPQMLRVDEASDAAANPDYRTFPQLAKQKYFNYLSIMVRRAKLHLPFVVRAEQNQRYAVSRATCLRCARSILHLKHLLPTEASELVGQIKILGIIHHFFLAVVVLAMDLCVNKADGDIEARKREVREACKIVEAARVSLAGAETFLESLLSVLKKHRIHLRQQETSSKPDTHANNGQPATNDVRVHWQAQNEQAVDETSLQDLDFGDVWQSYFDLGDTFDPQDWDALFSDLDMRLD